MKKLFILIALGSVSVLSADQYSSYGNSDRGYYQNGQGEAENTFYINGQNSTRGDQSYESNSQNYNGNSQSEHYNSYPRASSFNQNQMRGYNTYPTQVRNDSTNFNNDASNSLANSRADTQTVSDYDITKNIHDTLSPGWFSSGFQDVTFQVNDGNVTLKGTVKSQEDKNTVENDVRKINGVKQIFNNIAVTRDRSNNNSNTRSDSGYNSNFNNNSNSNQRSNSSYNNSNLNSNSNPNTNFRNDSTYNSDKYNTSYNTESKTRSNDYTDTQLQASEKKYPQDTASTPEDRQINAKIRNKISEGWFSRGNETIILRTSNGIVVITGTVAKPADIQKVADEARKVEGVKSVNNQATVQSK